MEFWGVEVKNGASLSVDPGVDMIVHISLVALGENKSNGNESVQLFLEKGDTKLLIGTLSHKKFPQLSTEIVLEKQFKLSHSWKNGSVFFTGYKVDASECESDAENNAEPAVAKSGVKQVNFKLPNKDNDDSDEDSSDDSPDDSSSDDSSGDSGNEEEKKVTAEPDNDEDDDEDDSSDDEDDDSSDDETPKKSEESNKRVAAEANTSKNPTSSKKAKFVTPQKTETKKPHVHIATPHPSKGVKSSSGSNNGEASKQNQQKTPKSGGAFECKPCKRTFNSEMGLESHTKAKHSAAA